MAQSREQKRLDRKRRKAVVRAAQYAAAALRKKQKGHKEAIKRPVKENGYKSNTLQARRNQRQADAVLRDCKHQSLHIAEQIAKAKTRRGGSERELARLNDQLEQQKQRNAR